MTRPETLRAPSIRHPSVHSFQPGQKSLLLQQPPSTIQMRLARVSESWNSPRRTCLKNGTDPFDTPMKKTILTIAAAAGTLALTSCISLALWGADEGSQARAEGENTTVGMTGETIQKGVQAINKAKDDAIDAVKDAVD